MKRKDIYLFPAKAAFVTVLAALVFFTSGSAFAANICVGPTATGNGSGSDWNNRAVFPFSTGNWNGFWVRGNTYYVADGTYTTSEGAPYPCVIRCSEANSGTQKIIIKKATAADCSGIAGWNTATMGSGTAIFQGTTPSSGGVLQIFYFTTDYWEIDGAIGTGNNANSYGFRTRALGLGTGTTYHATFDWDTSTPPDYITFKHIDFEGRGVDIKRTTEVDVTDVSIYWRVGSGYVYGLTVEDCYMHDTDSVFTHFTGVKNAIINRCYFARNESNAATHGEAMQNNQRGSDLVSENVVLKNSTFEDIEGTSVMSLNNVSKWYVYGNKFIYKNYPNAGQCSDLSTACFLGNGSIYCEGGSFVSYDIYVFNNTFYNMKSLGAYNGGFYDGTAASTVTPPGNAPMKVFNNIIVECKLNPGTGGWAGGTLSYNGWYNNYHQGNVGDPLVLFTNTSPPYTDTNRQNFTSSPFVSDSDLHLKAPTTAGVNPASIIPAAQLATLPDYNKDPDGRTRGGTASSRWDRGAYQYTDQAPPVNKMNPPAGAQMLLLQKISSLIIEDYSPNNREGEL